MIGWIVAAYFAGQCFLLLLYTDDDWCRKAYPAILIWPIAVPFILIRNTIKYFRTTCRQCALRFRTADVLRRHQATIAHLTFTPPGPDSHTD